MRDMNPISSTIACVAIIIVIITNVVGITIYENTINRKVEKMSIRVVIVGDIIGFLGVIQLIIFNH